MSKERILLAIGALVAAIAWDYQKFVNAQNENPDAKFDWRLAISRWVMIVSGVLTGGEVVKDAVDGSVLTTFL